MPVAVLGVVFFVAGAALCLPAAWRSAAPALRYARIGWAVGGVAMVVRLVYAELFQIDAICLWCTVVHAITAALRAWCWSPRRWSQQAMSGPAAR